MQDPSALEHAITSSSHAQAATLESAASRLSDLVDTITESRETVSTCAEVAREASKRCSDGHDAIVALDAGLVALTELVAKLPGVVEHIRDVQRQCQVIDKLAFHSHLLALNASIESARMGESGGAFSVVANGIRELASESRQAAERIKAAAANGAREIGAIEDAASQTLNQNQEAGRRCRSAIESIGTAVKRVDVSTGTLVASANAQAENVSSITNELRSQAEANAGRTSKLIGLVSGRTIEDLDPAQCQHQLNRLTLIDVRRTEEFNDELGHIEGATLMTLDDGFRDRLESLDPSDRYLFICRSGGRSSRAARIAQEVGLAHIYNMSGGMLRWNELGLRVA